ncbi:LLM class flavin-dependent oxidoreductase [Pseudonocardia sp. NPDC049635]|uniref:LLM class flavin-dependent oxidoreductase n=1 Tax=Pseudonocardia sp. NPDC049635 TaxID=3155506 RepID=UPI0033D1F716
MKFSLNLLTDRPAPELDRCWALCDEAGIDYVGVADSPMLVPELIVTATRAAARLGRSGVMTSVTNSVTRDVSVMASALASLDAVAPGRIACAIGTGDSALWTTGLRRASPAALERYVVALRTLLTGGTAEIDGRTITPHWPMTPARVPVLVTGTGPRALAAGARSADGLLLGTGFSEAALEMVATTVARETAAVGRDPREVELWWQTTITFGDTVEDAMARSLGINTSWLTADGKAGPLVPEHLREKVERFNGDMEQVGTTYRGVDRGRALVARADEMGLLDWLRSCAPGLWGPPEVIAAKLVEHAGRGRVNWQFYVAGDQGDRVAFTERFTGEVMPALARSTAQRETGVIS